MNRPTDRFRHEDAIADTIIRHLRHAKRERQSGEMVFRLRVNEGGPRGGLTVKLGVDYEFVVPLEDSCLKENERVQ